MNSRRSHKYSRFLFNEHGLPLTLRTAQLRRLKRMESVWKIHFAGVFATCKWQEMASTWNASSVSGAKNGRNVALKCATKGICLFSIAHSKFRDKSLYFMEMNGIATPQKRLVCHDSVANRLGCRSRPIKSSTQTASVSSGAVTRMSI